MSDEEGPGKRVSWVELYFDLVFVFAVGQTAHIMVTDPQWAGFGVALGLFMPLWWTWVGFVVLYNRHGTDKTVERLLVLAGTLPSAVAAIETHAAAAGYGTAFTAALAAARLVLAVSFRFTKQARRVAIGYALSTAAFAVSIVVPAPWRYGLWAIALLQEAGFLLLDDGKRDRDRRGERRGRIEALRNMLKPPDDPARGVDAGHLTERFGLMIIILLGELVVEVGAAAVAEPAHDARYWLGLLGGLILAAALWWIYFIAAAPINEYVLRASGGNPAMAYSLYAGGHLGPAFSLLTMASGVSLALTRAAPPAAAWFVTAGLAGYLIGTRAVVTDRLLHFGPLPRAALIAVTVCIAFFARVVSTGGVVLIAAAWAVAIAWYVHSRMPHRMATIAADPLGYFDARSRDEDESPADE